MRGKEIKIEDLIAIVKELRAKNPYPAKLFPEKTEKDWEQVHKALDKAELLWMVILAVGVEGFGMVAVID